MTRMARARLWGAPFFVAALALPWASACGGEDNAVLEMELTLPAVPADAPRPFAFVQVRRAEGFPFDATWLAGDDVPALRLMNTPSEDQISLLTEDDSIDVHVRVRFCASEDCSSLTDATAPEVRFALEHPFYLGQRTRWNETITNVPTETGPTTEVSRCLIRGCVQGPDATSYCRGDGTHLCEGS